MPGGDDAKKGYEASERKSGIFVITAFDVEDVSVCVRVSSSYIMCVWFGFGKTRVGIGAHDIEYNSSTHICQLLPPTPTPTPTPTPQSKYSLTHTHTHTCTHAHMHTCTHNEQHTCKGARWRAWIGRQLRLDARQSFFWRANRHRRYLTSVLVVRAEAYCRARCRRRHDEAEDGDGRCLVERHNGQYKKLPHRLYLFMIKLLKTLPFWVPQPSLYTHTDTVHAHAHSHTRTHAHTHTRTRTDRQTDTLTHTHICMYIIGCMVP